MIVYNGKTCKVRITKKKVVVKNAEKSVELTPISYERQHWNSDLGDVDDWFEVVMGLSTLATDLKTNETYGTLSDNIIKTKNILKRFIVKVGHHYEYTDDIFSLSKDELEILGETI